MIKSISSILQIHTKTTNSYLEIWSDSTNTCDSTILIQAMERCWQNKTLWETSPSEVTYIVVFQKELISHSNMKGSGHYR